MAFIVKNVCDFNKKRETNMTIRLLRSVYKFELNHLILFCYRERQINLPISKKKRHPEVLITTSKKPTY